MPSNDERRQVAARLRETMLTEGAAYIERRRGLDPVAAASFVAIPNLASALNFDKAIVSMRELADRLADLIEPEERTCRVELIDTGNEAAYEHYEHIAHCHSCHHEFGYVLYNEDGDTWQDEKPNYCPNCGAKVVDQ